MKKRIMLQKANKILAAVMTASMLTSTIVPGTAIYASEFTAAEVETEDGFTDGMEEETPVVAPQNQEETPEFDDGSAAAAEISSIGVVDETKVSSYADLEKAVNNPKVTNIKLIQNLTALENDKQIVINRSLTIDLEGFTITGNNSCGIFRIEENNEVTIKSSKGQGRLTAGNAKLTTGGNGGAICNFGKTVIENIKIDGNKTTGVGGGIYNAYSPASLTLIDVEITGNTCNNAKATTKVGNGIYSFSASIEFEGKVVIADNYDAKGISQENLYLNNLYGTKLIGSEGLKEGSDIRLSANESALSEDGDVVVSNFRKEYLKYFSSDKPNEQKLGFKNNYKNLYIGTSDAELSDEVSSHEWEYEVTDNGEIEFYCTEEGECEYKTPQILLQLNMKTNNMVYSGEPKEVTGACEENAEEIIGVAIKKGEIQYEGTNGTEYSVSPKAPTNAGTYKATMKVYIGDNEEPLTVTKEFEIAKADPVIGNNDLTYSGGQMSLVSLNGTPSDIGLQYSVDDGESWTDEIPTAEAAGEYTVKYKCSENQNYKTEGEIKVEIAKRPVTVSGIKANDKVYDGTTDATFDLNVIEFDGVIGEPDLGVRLTGKFEDKKAGKDKKVTIEEIALTGEDADNYTLTNSEPQETKATINQRPLKVYVTPTSAVYGNGILPGVSFRDDLADDDEVTPYIQYKGDLNEARVPEAVGTYDVVVRIAESENSSNYVLDSTEENPTTVEFKITPKDIAEADAIVNLKTDNNVDVIVKDTIVKDKEEEEFEEKTLEVDKDYKVETSQSDGTYTITINGIGNYKGSIVKTITAVEKPTDGNIVTAVTPEDEIVAAMKPSLEPISQADAKNLFAENLKKTDEQAAKIIKGEMEGSYDATVYLEMKALEPEDIKDNVAEDVAKVEALINAGKVLPSSAKIGQNLDLQLLLNYVARDESHVYGGTQKVTESSYVQKVTLTIPESLKTTAAYTTRTYYVICVHNGEAEVVKSTLSGDELSFNATKFSTYTIAYKDTYYAPSYPVTGIKVSTDKVNLTKKGETAQVKVEVTPSYADNKNLTWKSSDEKVATVDKDGKITAVGNGTATITVASVSGNYTATITVTVNDESEVKPGEIEKITIDTEAKTLTKIGESVELKVKVEPENADSSKLTWKSGNEKVAVVDKDGKVTAVGNGTATITVSTEDGKHTATVTITVKAADEPAANKTTSYGNLKARSVKQTNNSITLEWTRVSGADGYMIYGNRCNGNGKTYKYQKLATITNGKTRTWTQKGLTKGTYYKYIVKAYKLVNGKKVVTDTSVSVHAVTKGGKYGVAKAVSVTKIGSKKNTLKVTLKNGKTAQITAKEVKMDKAIRHHRNICYESSNTKVATVTPDGLIQATGKGTCSIWVYAQNGVYKTITVTVK